MSAFVAAIATRVSDSADAVARSVAPVDTDGAGTLADVLHKSAQDVAIFAERGPGFRLRDIPAYIDAIKNINGGEGMDDRKMFLEKVLVLMSRLPDDSEFAKSLQVFVIDTLYKDLPHPPAAYIPTLSAGGGAHSYPSTSAASYANVNSHANGHANGSAHHDSESHARRPYSDPSYNARRPYAARSADGTGYSTVYPDMGAARKPYARTVPSTHAYSRWPDAGLVFDALLARQPSGTTNGILPSSNPDAIPGHTTLPPTNNRGFAPQPGGLSSLFFAFADLVIHSCFNTSHSDWGINNVSSYLDLSPLYGSSDADLQKVRRFDGTGRLWEDVFADARVLFMPPSVPALLVLFCRNHNFIASKLLAINESGTFKSGEALADLSDEDRKAQDDELFARARLVNCGWFMRVILGDYVGAILGLVRDGLEWRLDPLAESREPDHSVSPRGEGNVVSLEFNLLYRWHAAISERDTAWTEHAFEEYFETTDFKSITIEQFERTLAQKLRPDPDVRKWTFDNVDNQPLARDPSTGGFNDGDLAALIQAATAAPAGAFKARGIPEVLRVVEIMGIEQARQWGTATMNEFRQFMGLKPFSSFEEWNSDPEIHKTAEMLYGDIDNLELHVGLQAEEAKPPIPGAGLCPGYTISRAILSDAVALVRGDRFLTTDFTVYNLTSWGYLDCFPQKYDGAYGGVLTRLLYRTLPEYYPARSTYARFPFMVPSEMRGYLFKLVNSPVRNYEFAPPKPPAPVVVLRDYKNVKVVLARPDEYKSDAKQKIVELTSDTTLDIHLVNKTLNFFIERRNYPSIFEHIAGKLIEEKSISCPGSRNVKYIDVVRDVINLVPVYFVATELMGLPIKTDDTPRGLFRDTEFAAMFMDVCNFVFINTDGYMDWVLRERSTRSTRKVTENLSEHLKRLSQRSIVGKLADSVLQWYTGEDNFSDTFLAKVLSSTMHDRRTLVNSLFGALIPSISLFSKSISHILDFFLQDEQADVRRDLVALCNTGSARADKEVYQLACEALRLNPPVLSLMRKESNPGGEPAKVYLSIVEANLDPTAFGDNPSSLDYRHLPGQALLGLEEYGLTNSTFFESIVPRVLRAIFTLKNVQRATGPMGTLNRIVETERGCPEVEYLDEKSEITPFPVSMVIQYEV
ncbi:heme peroxidase [Fomitiporia mediterranea MF3/22]|uniref:heme peroxidase n=1 Tax=Fomitiporia mediterranea (strain MF3/22) TaxID=694068 RepID=UPI000440770D|nr:heme peroxidase [Fomitiporia mediterranea MF3/22]EJD08383.1 heme peroxidase [Fomitiporia mediterranea MF3/22]